MHTFCCNLASEMTGTDNAQIDIVLSTGHEAIDDNYGLVGSVINSNENTLPRGAIDLD